MHYLESSNLDILSEYMRIKYNDPTIVVLMQNFSNASNSSLVFCRCSTHEFWQEVNYTNVWESEAERVAKIRKLKRMIKNVNRF